MSRVRIEEVYFDHEPAPAALRTETAAVFGVRPDHVIVERLDEPAPVGSMPAVRWLRDTEDMPGDFPAWYYLHTEIVELNHLNDLLSSLTRRLGIAALSQVPDPDTLALHGPDGSLHVVPIVQDMHNDYALVLAPTDRAVLAQAYHNTARKVAS